MTDAPRSTLPEWKILLKPALGAALVGVLLCALGAIVWPEQFFRSYLVAYLYWLGIALGCLVLLMLQHVTGGKWGLVLRSILEAATRTLPLCAVLFLPLLLGLSFLYPWTNAAQLASATTQQQKELVELIERKEPYLNVPFFVIRAVVYFAIWNVLAFALSRLSARNEQQSSSLVRWRLRAISGPGLALYGLTITLAAVDWVMSMEPLWYSTIFGVVLAVSQLLPALAFAVAVLIWLAPRPDVTAAMDKETWGDLGNLLLAFAMLWAYMGFSQFFLIWCGNLPEETIWYSHRAWGFWELLAWSLIVFYFCLPFALLLSRDIKRQPRRLAWVSGIVLVMAYVHYFWLVMPAPESLFAGYSTGVGRPLNPAAVWLDIAAFVTIGGLWLGWFLWQLQARPLLSDRELERLEVEKEAQHG